MQLRVTRKLKERGPAKAMSESPRSTRPGEGGGETADANPTVDSVTLMKGRRELIIRHGVDTYRLRITASNKLILTK
jgi:hemin uptake protein HemP